VPGRLLALPATLSLGGWALALAGFHGRGRSRHWGWRLPRWVSRW